MSVCYEQRLYRDWWDLQLRLTLHSTFSTKLLHTDHKVFFPSHYPLSGHSFCLLCSGGKKILFFITRFSFPTLPLDF